MHGGVVALHRPVERCVGDCSSPDFTHTAWAFCGGRSVGRIAVRGLRQDRQSGVWATSAHRTSQVRHGHLRLWVGRARCCLGGLCQDRRSGVWATSAHQTLPTRHGRSAVTSRSDTLLVRGALPESAGRRVGDYSSPDFTSTAWASAVANRSKALLLKGAASISRAVCGRLQLARLH